MLAVCARTTRCANLIQHIRTVDGEDSQIEKILALIPTSLSHEDVSYALPMLSKNAQVSQGHVYAIARTRKCCTFASCGYR